MKKRMIVVEAALVFAMTLALSITATYTSDKTEAPNANDSSALVASSEESTTAGVAGTLNSIELEAANQLSTVVSIEIGDTEHVASAMDESRAFSEETDVETEEVLSDNVLEETTEETVESEDLTGEVATEVATDSEAAETIEATVAEALSEEEIEWQNYLMPDVNKSLNVRKSASEDADVVGKLYKGDRATIVEVGEEWTQIVSGNVEGYVKNSHCVFGLDALAYAKANCEVVAKATIDGLRVRKEASLEASVSGKLDKGAKLTVDKEAEEVEGWVAVRYKNNTRYVSADYVTVSMKIGTGVTLAEEAKAKEEASKPASSKSKKSSSRKICDLAYEVDEVTLLAGIIECEAGGQDYEALLAVGASIMNRVESSHYPDNIFDVIHQKGQFPPATSGCLERWLKKGPTKKAIKAAKAAMNGDDNTGGKCSFQMASTGHKGLVIGDNVFY